MRQALMAPISYSFPSPPVPEDGLVLGVASTHCFEKHAATSTTVVWSVAFIAINSSDK